MKIVVFGSLAHSLINFRGILLKDIQDQGHEVIACASRDGLLQDYKEVEKTLDAQNIRFYAVDMNNRGMNPWEDLKTLWQLFRLFRKIKPDMILSYTIKPVIYGSLAGYFSRVPHRFSMVTGIGHLLIGDSFKHKLVRLLILPLYRRALRRNNVIFFQNSDDLQLFQNLNLVLPGQSQIINGSGIDLEYFPFTPPLKHPVIFLMISRLLAEKGVREYIDAAKIIKRKYPDTSFRLIGPLLVGSREISLEQVQQWEKDQYIEYLGETPDVRPFISQVNVYVLPSYREGTPRTVLEAMAMGRPIITTDVPGCRETVIDGENGFLVPVKDAQALALAMEKLIQNPELIAVMGQKSRTLAEQKYDVHQVNQVILKSMGLVS
ncbi:glycosyltransferase family 4 protein [Deltaproteobacteria bacterium TL4]